MNDKVKLFITNIFLLAALFLLIYTNKDRIDPPAEEAPYVVETGKEIFEDKDGNITTITTFETNPGNSFEYSDERKPDYRIVNELNTSPTEVEYTWISYEGLYYATISYTIDEGLFQYYRSLPRYYRDNDYLNYIKDPINDQYIGMVVDNLKEIGNRRGYSEGELVRETINFVQGLEYVEDEIITEKMEWPKYPLETLYERSGDCEDFSVLLAGVLSKMGYGVVLIKYSDHMAVGLKGNESVSGVAFSYEGNNYYYVETTGTGWEIGEIPDEYRELEATIIPVY